MLIVGGGGKSQFWRSLFASIYNKTIIETNVGQDAAALARPPSPRGCGLWDSYDRVRDVHERRGAIAPTLPTTPCTKLCFPFLQDLRHPERHWRYAPGARAARLLSRLGAVWAGRFPFRKGPPHKNAPLHEGAFFAV